MWRRRWAFPTDTAIGLDDSPRQRQLPIDRENKICAQEEIARVSGLFKDYRIGLDVRDWIVPPEKLADRLDVKSCLTEPGRLKSAWEMNNIGLSTLRNLVQLLDKDNFPSSRVIYTPTANERVKFLRVRYDGIAEEGDEKDTSDVEYEVLLRVAAGDIAISNINAVHGDIAVVPDHLDGCVVSSEVTLCRPKPGIDAHMIWILTRSSELKADLLLFASGMGRTRIRWENARELLVPALPPDKAAEITAIIQRSKQLADEAERCRREAEDIVYQMLGLDNKTAWHLLRAFKPPK